MTCTRVRPLFSSYMDGAVSGAEMHEVSEHLSQCAACESEFGRLENTRILISSLGPKQAPPDLAFKIRIALSSARSRSWPVVLQGYLVLWQNAFRSFMLPAMAGVATAIFLFVILIGFFVPAQVSADDVPTMLYTPPRLLSSVYVDNELNLDPSILIETDVDASGRVQSFRIVAGRDDAQVREQVSRALLFTIFAPATSFGRPVPGTAHISFFNINVRG
jgi:hypothetical protein